MRDKYPGTEEFVPTTLSSLSAGMEGWTTSSALCRNEEGYCFLDPDAKVISPARHMTGTILYTMRVFRTNQGLFGVDLERWKDYSRVHALVTDPNNLVGKIIVTHINVI